MSLEKARTALEEALKSGQDALSDLNIGRTLGLTNDWFGWYKHWEAHDTFFAAIRERRMTFRQGPADQDTKKDINMTSLAAPTEKSKKHVGYKYEVGLDSVAQRMDPRSFERGGSVDPRGKYEHGLHDLSASLMSPDKPTISEQVRWKPPKNVSAEVAKSAKFNKWAVIFMPLGQPQDLALFALLNSMAKEARLRQPAFYGRVVEMRRQITRMQARRRRGHRRRLPERADQGGDAGEVPLRPFWCAQVFRRVRPRAGAPAARPREELPGHHRVAAGAGQSPTRSSCATGVTKVTGSRSSSNGSTTFRPGCARVRSRRATSRRASSSTTGRAPASADSQRKPRPARLAGVAEGRRLHARGGGVDGRARRLAARSRVSASTEPVSPVP